jgi:hypothetical protein
MRLGAGFSFAEPIPEKPRGMHWRTYLRMRTAAGAAEGASVAMTMKNFSRPNAALGVAGYPQNGRYGRAGRGSNRLGHNVEIETYLRSNHRQDEQCPD